MSTYNYTRQQWYYIPKSMKGDVWSEPYIGTMDDNREMTTFAHPLYDKRGKLIAMFAADVSLKEITDFVEKVQPYSSDKCYSFLLSCKGSYLTNHNNRHNSSIFSEAERLKNEDYGDLGKEMIAGKTGVKQLRIDDQNVFAFYTDIPSIGWSVCCLCPSSEIFSGLSRATRIGILLFVIGLAVILLLIFQIIKHQTRPLLGFAYAACDIAAGKFDIDLPQVRTHDEIMLLRNSFDHMRLSLQDYIARLRATTIAKERIEQELSIARKIQMGMLPKIFPPFADRVDVDLHAILQPAKQVGGDLYDFFIDGDRLYFAIGDVSGKGVPASLFMAITSSLFRTLAKRENTTDRIMCELNDSIIQSNRDNMFVTMIVGILDLTNGKLHLCNAGHNPLLLVDHCGSCRYVSLTPNLPVGLENSYKFKSDEIQLDPQSKILLYTDGVTEAEDERQNLYGEKRLKEVVSVNHKKNVRNLVKSIADDVKKHVGNALQSDDITMMIIDFMPKSGQYMRKELVIRNTVTEIPKIEAFVEDVGEEAGICASVVASINLALEEAVANVVMYAYPQPGTNDIHLYSAIEGNELVFVLTDSGTPFDPTKVVAPDVEAAIESRKVGGLGILLVRKIMNEVSYQRINGENQLTLKKIIKNQDI